MTRANSVQLSSGYRSWLVVYLAYSKPTQQRTLPTPPLYTETGLGIDDGLTTKAADYYLFATGRNTEETWRQGHLSYVSSRMLCGRIGRRVRCWASHFPYTAYFTCADFAVDCLGFYASQSFYVGTQRRMSRYLHARCKCPNHIE